MSDQANEVRRLTLISGAVDLLLSVIKVVAGTLANSQSLVADGIHSLSDLATDIMVLVFNRLSAEAPDREHPYGHGRFETLGSMILGSILLAVAGNIVFEAGSNLARGELTIPTGPLAIGAALFSIAANEWLYRITIGTADRIGSNLLRGNAWHHRSDALSSIVVLIGVSGAMFGQLWLEPVAAMIVAIMIGLIGWRLVSESASELVDTALTPEETAELIQTATRVRGVRDVHDLRSRRAGGAVMLDLHIQVEPTLSVSEGHFIGDSVHASLRQHRPDLADVVVHIDTMRDAELEVELPERADVETVLIDACQGVVHEADILGINLHYRGTRVDAELYLTDQAGLSNERRETIRDRCRATPWLGEITFWQPA